MRTQYFDFVEMVRRSEHARRNAFRAHVSEEGEAAIPLSPPVNTSRRAMFFLAKNNAICYYLV